MAKPPRKPSRARKPASEAARPLPGPAKPSLLPAKAKLGDVRVRMDDEAKVQVAALVQQGMSRSLAMKTFADEFRKAVILQAKRIAKENARRLVLGLSALPPPPEIDPTLSPEEHVRRRLAAIAPRMVEERIQAAISGHRVDRREAQQELLDRAGFGRKVDGGSVGGLTPAITIRLESNPYLNQTATVEGEVVPPPQLPEDFEK
jgi:hypothetical protein